MVSLPPGRVTVTRSLSLPWLMPITTAAQAPVPQARVSPTPRSNTRNLISLALTISMKPTLTRSGKRSWRSMMGPRVSTGASATEGTSMTQ